MKSLENEGVEYSFGIPGEENFDAIDALLDNRNVSLQACCLT